MLIEVEGIDGIGKTTQCTLLEERNPDFDFMVVKEPGTTPYGIAMKRLLESETERHPLSEMFSFLACKSQTYNEIIIPGMRGGRHMIMDRGTASFLSYHHIKTVYWMRYIPDTSEVSAMYLIFCKLQNRYPEMKIRGGMTSGGWFYGRCYAIA